MKRLKILFVAHSRPISASGIAPVPFAYQVPKHLSLMHDVHLAWLDPGGPGEQDVLRMVRGNQCKFSSVQSIPVRTPRRDFLGYIFAVPRRYPYALAEMEKSVSERALSAIKDLTSTYNPEIVHASGAPLALPLAGLRGVPKVLAPLDCMWAVQRSVALSSKNPFRRAHHLMYSVKLKKYESDFYPAFDSVIFLSERDAVLAKQANPRIKARVIPLGVDVDSFVPSRDSRKRLSLIFHGSMSHPPNREAATFLIEEVFPAVRRRVPEASLILIGKSAPPNFLADVQGTDGVSFLGSVADLPAHLARGAIYLSPLFSGGGMKNKILEAMACGLPVVGSPESFTGLHVVPRVHCLIAKNSSDFVEASMRLLLDAAEREKIGMAARKLVETNYSWKETARRCTELYGSLVSV